MLRSAAKRSRLLCLLVTASFSLTLAAQTSPFEASFQGGTEALRAGNLDAAAQDFTQAIKLNPAFAEAHFNLGLVRVEQGRFDEAISSLSRCLALKPKLRGANLFLGIAYYRKNDYGSAITALKRETANDPANAKAFMWLGVAELAKGDSVAATAVLDKAAQLKPNDVDILYHRGRAHMLVSNASYEDMYKADPNSWRVHQVLAQSFAEADRLDDAIAECKLAIQAKPDGPELHQQLGDLYWQKNQLPDAEAEFQNELKADPSNSEAMYKLAVISIERSKTEVAQALLKEVLLRTPHSPDAEYQLGRAQAQMGEVDPAVENFKAAVADSKGLDTETLRQSYYQLAQLYRRQQKPQESKAALDAFMQLKQKTDAQQAQNLQDKMRRSAQLQETAR
jgi:tetratricopeptide (TPR) repeat protein